jgi:Xaa-Pro aminopeptidase
MLSAAGCAARRRRLWDSLPDAPDWVLVTEPRRLMYFANYFASPFVFRSANSQALLALSRDGASILIADSMSRSFLEQAHAEEKLAPVWYNGKESAPLRSTLFVASALARLADCGGSHFGYEAAWCPAGILDGLRARPHARLTPIDAALRPLERAKEEDEIALLRRSISACATAFDAAWRNVRPGMTELEVYPLVLDAATRTAGEQVQVYGDFVSGPRCEKVGGPPTSRAIEPGDLVLLDFSVVMRGYRGDLANTFACGQRAKPEQTWLYEACLESLAAGEKLLGPGRPAREVDAAMRAAFARRGLEATFTSHGGHGVGLGHPDPPYIVPQSSDVLEPGDVVALEPGQYVPGVAGMRYERNYLITPSGYETLSHHQLQIDQPQV